MSLKYSALCARKSHRAHNAMNMRGRNPTQQEPQLAPAQMRALELYAQGANDTEVASTLGIERSTAWRWRTTDPQFRRELRRAHAEATKVAAARLEGLVEKALDVLASALTDNDAPLALRLRAAEAVLDRTGIESNDTTRDYATSPMAGLLDD
jgi:hypothetical protein